MDPDDDQYLSARLDGELDPEQRLRVDSALHANPELSERYRELGRVSEAVSTLSRPASPRDHAIEILAELNRHRSVFTWFGPKERSILTKSLVLFGAAASLVACATLGLSLVTKAMNGPDSVFRLTGFLKPKRAVEVKQELASNGKIGDVSRQEKAPLVVADGSRPQSSSPPVVGVNPEVIQVRRLLRSPNLREQFVVTDILGDDAQGWVGRYLKTSPRHDDSFARLSLNRGHDIDPDQPEEAVVFVVVLEPRELVDFRRDFQNRFPFFLLESVVDPAVAERLAAIDSTLIEEGTQIANVIVPGDLSRARLSDPNTRDETKVAFHTPGNDVEDDSNRQTFSERPRARTGSKMVDRPEDGPKSEATPEASNIPVDPGNEKAVVLVWVKSRGGNPLKPAK